jgi:hypothetical protein
MEALLISKIANHAQVTDPNIRIPEVVSEGQCERYRDEARLEAPFVIEQGMKEYRRRIDLGIEHTPAA